MDNNVNIKRQIAYKVRINDIINSEYVKEEGWKPNYIKTKHGNISRVNILATVVAKNDDGSFIIDDGSDKINAKFFDNRNTEGFSVGDIIQIIGRPREWNSQKYIMPETIKKLEDKRWINVRKLELSRLKEYKKEEKIEKEEEVLENPYDLILKLIKDMDSGNGASYEEVLVRSKVKEGEEILTALLEQGEIFEIKPGRLKILE